MCPRDFSDDLGYYFLATPRPFLFGFDGVGETLNDCVQAVDLRLDSLELSRKQVAITVRSRSRFLEYPDDSAHLGDDDNSYGGDRPLSPPPEGEGWARGVIL